MNKVIIILFLFFLIFKIHTEDNIPTPKEKKALKQVEKLLKQSIKQERKLHRRRHYKRRKRRNHHKRNRKALLGGLLTGCHDDDPDCVLSLKEQEIHDNYKNFLNYKAKSIPEFLGLNDMKDVAAAGLGTATWAYSNYKDGKRKTKLKYRKQLMEEKKAFEDVFIKIMKKENHNVDSLNLELRNLDKRIGSIQNDICEEIQSKTMAHENRKANLRRYQ